MPNKILFLILSFVFLSTTAMAEETKTEPKKKTESQKQKPQEKKNSENKKSTEQKKTTEKKKSTEVKKDTNKKTDTQKKKEAQKKTVPKKKVHYYPKPKKPVILGKEKYEKVNKSLKGLKAVYINLDSYLQGSKKRKMKIPFDVKKKVIAILKKHNIKLLNKEGVKWKFGQPTINISTSFPAFLGPYKKGEKKKTYNNCCSASVSASLTEGARVLRNPDLNMQLTTWKTAQRTTDCAKLEDWFPKAVIKVVEKFVSDKAKAENKTVPKKKVEKKKVVKKPEVKKPVIKKPVVKKEIAKKPVVQKPVVKKEKVVKQVVKEKAINYTSHGNLAYTAPARKVVVKKTVVKKVQEPRAVAQAYPARAYQRAPVTTKVVEQVVQKVVSTPKVVPVQKVVAVEKFVAPTVVQKELVCANTSPLVGGEELYRKVVTYERVMPQQQVVSYEVVRPQETIYVEEAKELVGCEQSTTMNMEVFRTGSSQILTAKQYMLDTFVNKINACPNYKYTIETHADQRGSHAYNDKLTKNRAVSIATYLQSRGIASNRFNMQSFGEKRPISFGTSPSDYSKNRRVVMIPHKINNK
ncbi:MAG: Unknown protein [uncultured Sulfurovum sp.]|uniref:OmpA-like domain-containing protein n=1 Tax=uncultured Sulfurovum sp. TaxID=269237 RepID=A0A6S6S470_9BACT|nr:MAG: Unknown protein [uncultured Sulfurovum sp.]